jgi:hypothetical protein
VCHLSRSTMTLNNLPKPDKNGIDHGGTATS